MNSVEVRMLWCPTHGRRFWRRVERDAWWECPALCTWVAPDEYADGNEVRIVQDADVPRPSSATGFHSVPASQYYPIVSSGGAGGRGRFWSVTP